MTKTALAVSQPTLLEEIMLYEHPGLAERFQEKLGLNEKDATELFADTKRFLFLCGTNKGQFAPPPQVDEGWHHFMLFTKDYEAFCQHYFGRFLHHSPKTREDKKKGDREIVPRTLMVAKGIFGPTLSVNWVYAKTAEGDCEGSTNCQQKECVEGDCTKID